LFAVDGDLECPGTPAWPLEGFKSVEELCERELFRIELEDGRRDLEILRLLRRKRNAINPITARPANATPTPMPILAPGERPLSVGDGVDVGVSAAGEVVIGNDIVVEAALWPCSG
jgi:hypothetical protein